MDTLTPTDRSRVMRAVKSKNTEPERITRSILHALGYRFRLHVQDLPGKPDIVLPKYRTVVEVHGCFWHGHSCGRCRIPATHRDYWISKINRNRKRNSRTSRELKRRGWTVIVVWECQTRNVRTLRRRLARALQRSKTTSEATHP